MMIGKIWYNPVKDDDCWTFLVILDDLDQTDYPEESGFTYKGFDLDVAGKLYQANRNQYPSLIV